MIVPSKTDNAHAQPCFAHEAIYAASLTGSSPFTPPPNLANPVSTPGPTSSPAKTQPNSKPSPPNSSSTTSRPAQHSSRSSTPSSPPSGSSVASAASKAQLWNYRVECLDQNLTHAEFVDASIQHNSPLGHSFQDRKST